MTCRTNLLPHSPKSLMVSRSTRLGISRIPERYNQCTRAWPPRISGRCCTTLEKNSWRFYFRSYFTTYIVLSYSNILIGINILHMTNYLQYINTILLDSIELDCIWFDIPTGSHAVLLNDVKSYTRAHCIRLYIYCIQTINYKWQTKMFNIYECMTYRKVVVSAVGKDVMHIWMH